jgi:hypothetical protein
MAVELVRMRLSSNKNITISNVIIIIIIIITCYLFKGIVYRLYYITVITANNII